MSGNAILYLATSGWQRWMLPRDFPVLDRAADSYARRDSGLLRAIDQLLVKTDRGQIRREASPRASAINNQSVKTTESGGVAGHDAGKTIKGRQRHTLPYHHPAEIRQFFELYGFRACQGGSACAPPRSSAKHQILK